MHVYYIKIWKKNGGNKYVCKLYVIKKVTQISQNSTNITSTYR